MTLWINELSFDRAKIVTSPDNFGVVSHGVHNSNYPDYQQTGIKDAGFEIVLTLNTSEVFDKLAQIRGILKNREFVVIRSDEQYLRDNKQTIFAKIASINVDRKVGTVYHTELKLNCRYVGTQGSHQPNYYVNSVQVENDWEKAGTTMLALPVGAYSPSETVQEDQIASHSIILTPSWATGVDTQDASYDADSVARGTIGFNLDFTTMFTNTVKIYDGSYSSGNHKTDTDHDFQFSGNTVTIRQDNWQEIVFNVSSGNIVFRKYSGGSFVEYFRIFPNSGQGFSDLYVLSLNDHYIRIGLDSEDELELYSCKLPCFIPGNRNAYFTGTALNTGSVSGIASDFNFIQATTTAWVGSNRFFTIETSGSNHIMKPASNAGGNSGSDIHFWFGWESNSTDMDTKMEHMLRRLE